MTRASAIALVLSVLSIACGEPPVEPPDASSMIDGGTDVDAGADPRCDPQVDEPAAPALPAEVTWSCVEGWTALAGGGCSPWPAGVPEECAAGEAHFPGTDGCAPIGTECPSGDFSEPPAAYAAWDRIYVNPIAAPGGDGATPSTAMSSFRDARVLARMRTEPVVILLARGEYPSDLPVGLPKNTLVWGACVSETVLLPTAGTTPELVLGAIEGWSGLGNVSVTGATRGVLTSSAGVELHLEGVLVHDVTRWGLLVQDGGRLTGSRVVVRDVASPGSTARGTGISILDSTAELSQVIAEGAAAGIAVASAGPASSARLQQAVLRDNEDSGALVFVGAELELDATEVAENLGYGITTLDGTVRLADSVVRDNRYKDDEATGVGIAATESADRAGVSHVILERVLLDGNERFGIWLDTGGQTLTATQAIIRNTKPHLVSTSTNPEDDGLDGAGIGIQLEEDSLVYLDRVLLEENHIAAMGVFGPVAKVVGRDVTIRAVRDGLNGFDGNGIYVEGRSELDLTRTLIEHTEGKAISATERALLVFDDLTVRDAARVDSVYDGVGLGIADDARAYVTRGRIERSELYGVGVQEGGRVELTDVAIVETRPQRGTGVFGLGIGAVSGGSVRADRLLLENNQAAAIVASTQASLELTSLIIRGTRAGLSSFRQPVGRGVSIEIGTTATISRARIEGSLDIGVLVDGDSTLVLRDALVSDSPGIDGQFGRGAQAQGRSRIDLANVCIADDREVGLLASNAEIYGREVDVLGTAHNACFDDGTCDVPGGIGVYAAAGSRIALSGFLLSGNVETGLTVAGGEVDLVDGTISFSALGADVRDPAFDQSRITTTVDYVDNGVNGVEGGSTKLPDTDTSGLY